MNGICVLITGGGAPGIAGTIHALRNNDDNVKIKIVTVDAREDVVGKYLSDKFYKVPMANDKNFLEEILNICEKEKVNVLLPQVTRELEIFSQNKHHIENAGIRPIVMSSEVMKIVNDKYRLMEEYTSLGFDQGKYKLIRSKEELLNFAEEIGYPHNIFVVKPPLSNGMRGLRIVTEEKLSIEKFLHSKPSGAEATLEEICDLFEENFYSLELVAMEYFPGMEYTVDVYRSPISKNTLVVPRTRDIIRTGITFEGELVKNEEIIQMSRKMAIELDMEYCFGFQYKIGKDQKPHLLECNPRVQGTMIMSILGGANMIYWSVKEALGEKVDLEKIKIKWGMKFKRYWGGIGIYNGQITKVLEAH